MFNPSTQQQAFFEWLRDAKGSALLEACAGGGKTTTILEGLRHVPSDPDAFFPPGISFLAFNKSIADTLKARCPASVNVSTFHSHGFRALKASGRLAEKLPHDFVDSGKVRKMAFNAMGDVEDVKSVVKLVGLLKSVNPHDPDFIASPIATAEKLVQHYSLEFEESKASIAMAVNLLRESARKLDSIDFDDMLWLPILFKCSFSLQDYVFVDESQDTNDIQLEILSQMGNAATRYVFVGDRYQAIYGFRGANADSMDRIKSRFNCTTLHLSVSYRCPKNVCYEARKALTSSLFQ